MVWFGQLLLYLHFYHPVYIILDLHTSPPQLYPQSYHHLWWEFQDCAGDCLETLEVDSPDETFQTSPPDCSVDDDVVVVVVVVVGRIVVCRED